MCNWKKLHMKLIFSKESAHFSLAVAMTVEEKRVLSLDNCVNFIHQIYLGTDGTHPDNLGFRSDISQPAPRESTDIHNR